MRVDIYIKGQRISQFKDDESILINRRAKDYRSIDKLFSDYSESFTVPGEPNNYIFRHFYDADIEEGFDARIKQPAKIFVDQELYKEGLINLVDLKIENNRVKHYKIQFFTEITQLKDLFGEDELNDLDFSDYNFVYNRQTVATRLSSDNDLIFPLISYKRRFLYNTTNTLDAEIATDIAKSDGSVGNEGIEWRELKPAIRYKVILNKIESKYGINFTGTILNDSRLTELYMNLNGQDESDDENSGTVLTDEEVSRSSTIDLSSSQISGFTTFFKLTPDTNYVNVTYNLKVFVNNILQETYSGLQGESTKQSDFNKVNFSDSVFISFVIESDEEIFFSFETKVSTLAGPSSSLVFQDSGSGDLFPDGGIGGDSPGNATAFFQDFKVADFLKSFVKMFNLIIIPNSETSFNFKPLQQWYSEGRIIDITKYVDNQNYKVSPGKLINKLDFTFESNETFLSNQFKKQNGRGYGNLRLKLEDINGRKLRGDAIEIKLPFEKPIYERIFTTSPGVQYGFLVDKSQDEFQSNHAIFYAPLITGVSIYLVDKKNPSFSNQITSAKMPFNSFNDNFHIGFKNEFDEFSGSLITDNFYKSFYEDYVTDLFSPKRKNYFKKSHIPAHIMQNLKLNDRLVIGQRRYIINSLQENIIKGTQELDLFNDIFEGNESV